MIVNTVISSIHLFATVCVCSCALTEICQVLSRQLVDCCSSFVVSSRQVWLPVHFSSGVILLTGVIDSSPVLVI